jgi:hypothetical protein
VEDGNARVWHILGDQQLLIQAHTCCVELEGTDHARSVGSLVTAHLLSKDVVGHHSTLTVRRACKRDSPSFTGNEKVVDFNGVPNSPPSWCSRLQVIVNLDVSMSSNIDS